MFSFLIKLLKSLVKTSVPGKDNILNSYQLIAILLKIVLTYHLEMPYREVLITKKLAKVVGPEYRHQGRNVQGKDFSRIY